MNEYLRVNYKYYCFGEARFWLMVGFVLLSGSLTAFLLQYIFNMEGLKILIQVLALISILPLLAACYYIIRVKIHERKNS